MVDGHNSGCSSIEDNRRNISSSIPGCHGSECGATRYGWHVTPHRGSPHQTTNPTSRFTFTDQLSLHSLDNQKHPHSPYSFSDQDDSLTMHYNYKTVYLTRRDKRNVEYTGRAMLNPLSHPSLACVPRPVRTDSVHLSNDRSLLCLHSRALRWLGKYMF
jgi:hypothetical protein